MIVVSIILSSLVLGSFFNKQIRNKLVLICNLSDDLNYSINFALSQPEVYYDSLNLNGPSYINIKKSPWGVYNTISVKGCYKGLLKSKTVLTSQIVSRKELPVLIVKNARNVVSITGKTDIIGNIFTPKGYLERAYIENKTYINKKISNGKVFKSSSYKPNFDAKLFENRFNNLYKNSNNESTISRFPNSDSLNVSFYDETETIYSNKEIILNNIAITGNIIIKSDSLVVIRNSCKIQNAIILAPIITVESGFKGSVQLIASDSIVLDKNVELTFPSSIVLYQSKIRTPSITLNNNCKVYGSIYAYMPNNSNSNSLIIVNPNTEIIGSIYSNSIVDFRGIMNGVLICNKVVASTKSSFYEDVIIDAKFYNSVLPNFIITAFTVDNKDNEQILFEL